MVDFRQSVVLITSEDPKLIEKGQFGTGFIIYREQETSYILTCAHVVADVGGVESVKVAGKKATVKVMGNKKGCDLAVLAVEIVSEEWINRSPLKLAVAGEVGMDFQIVGFYTDGTKTYKQAQVKGKLGEIQFIDTPEGDRTKAWDLRINKDSTQQLQSGYSGSPIFANNSEYVLGVASQLTGENKGLAISVEALKELWKNMPHGLISSVPPSPQIAEPNDNNEKYIEDIVDGFQDGRIIPVLCAGVDLCDSASTTPEKIAKKIAEHLRSSTDFKLEGFIGASCLVCPQKQEQWSQVEGDTQEERAYFEKIKATNIERCLDSQECGLSDEQRLALAKINLRLISQYFQVENQPAFYRTIRDLCDPRVDKNNPVHNFLASLPRKMFQNKKLPYELILTTSYDDGLERAFCKQQQPFDLIYYVAEGQHYGQFKLKQFDASKINTYDEFCDLDGDILRTDTEILDKNLSKKDRRPIILKLFGIWTDKFVITEDHYLGYLNYNSISNIFPPKLVSLITDGETENQILLLGYSPSYFELELVLRRFIANQVELKGVFNVVHQSKRGSLEEKIWKKKGAIPIKKTLQDFIKELNKKIDDRLSQ